MRQSHFKTIGTLAGLVLISGWLGAVQISPLNTARVGKKLEFRLDEMPSASNPFDPELIRVDGQFTGPDGTQRMVPGFWYVTYSRSISGNAEILTAGPGQWRLRFTPPREGPYSLTVTVATNGVPAGQAGASFTAAPALAAGPAEAVRISANRQYFEFRNGESLRLIGENVGWHGPRGTLDYDTWFPSLQRAGANFARVWMCPWAFGLEAEPSTLTKYRQDRAWQLDRVFDIAAEQGIFLLLCLDYHGMFATQPDMWGGNNNWPQNPYNTVNGGPATTPNEFFKNTTARSIYQKRLRYLVARYGYSPQLLAWEFLNEIDNVYASLTPADVNAWHGVMGRWLKANDPFQHLVTSSLTGNSDRADFWSVPELDFAAYHSYGEPAPATRLATVTQSFLSRYKKPVMIGEFGISAAGWNRASDPYLRGFRQALWGGALGGSVGTAMSWWWENIESENVYPVYTALGQVLKRTGWGRGTWAPVGFKLNGPPPGSVGEAIPGGEPFNTQLSLDTGWGTRLSGQLAIANSDSAGYASRNLNAFVHGSAHADLRQPFRLQVWLTNNARLVLHLNSVSSGSTLAVKSDGTLLLRTNLANLDGGYNVNNEYNVDFTVALPAGRRVLEITNLGNDWFYLDWVRVERAIPSAYANSWEPSPEPIGLRGERESLIYVVAPGAAFPAGATNATLPARTQTTLTLTNWPAGPFVAEWYDPATGEARGFSQAAASAGSLTLTLPNYSEDLAGLIYPPPRLSIVPGSPWQLQLESETGGRYTFETSTSLPAWVDLFTITNTTGHGVFPIERTPDLEFWRAVKRWAP